MVLSYLVLNPDVKIDYVVASSTELMRAIGEEDQAFDLAVSSAMDLQTKLANDGKALQHRSSATQSLPSWAVWNDMVFAFTEEPAAIVVSKTAFEGLPIPADRHQLINLLRQQPDRFRGKVGTYDVRQSGLGYLFATQDTRASETYWRLTEVLGGLEAKLYCCSSNMIDAVKSGDLLLAYNVLGSYAVNRPDRDDFAIILPADFTTIMLRTILIPKAAQSLDLAQSFIDHILQQSHGQGSRPLADQALNLDLNGSALNRIRLGPGLLVYLDQLKARAFMSEWENAIFQD